MFSKNNDDEKWHAVYSLVVGGSRVEHVSLQFRKESLLVFALTDLHVQQVWVDGCVVDLHQPLLNCLCWRRCTQLLDNTRKNTFPPSQCTQHECSLGSELPTDAAHRKETFY